MKDWLNIIVGIVMLSAVFTFMAVDDLYAADFDKSQHNFKIKSDNYAIEFRKEMNNSVKDHIQFSLTPGDTALDLRISENENRFRISKKVGKNFYLKPRLEYRDLDHAENYFRIRPIVGYSTEKVWIEFEPTYNLDKPGETAFSFNSSKITTGFKAPLNEKISFDPFIQYEMDDSFDKTGLFLGTNLTFKF